MKNKNMKTENDKDNSKRVNTDQIMEVISKRKLSPKASKWLTSQPQYIVDLINVYADDPDTFGLHNNLRENPLLILETVLHSAELLFSYQEAYNGALFSIAEVNGVMFNSLEEIPELLQKKSTDRERARILHHINSGGVVVMGLMGSGASGKGTMGKRTGMQRAVNYTTRLKRPGEEHGKDYYYIREMEPGLADRLDIDTGFRITGRNPKTNEPIYETDENDKPINYFEKYGPYITTVHRPGRAKHGTSIKEFEKYFNNGEKAIFFEHGPIQVQEAGEKLPKFMANAAVFPICVLPPKTGIIPLALRIAVRTYGDKDHQDNSVVDGYKIQESYLESTIGMGQIEELAWTKKFLKGKQSLGITYIVNDNLDEAVRTLRSLISPK